MLQFRALRLTALHSRKNRTNGDIMRPITEIADVMGLDPASVIPYGRYKAKIGLEAIRSEGPRGKLILMTGMTPTRAGEGKTTTVGLTQALGQLGHRSMATLREPSLGPIFGIKGGGTGGGEARVMPEDEINVDSLVKTRFEEVPAL